MRVPLLVAAILALAAGAAPAQEYPVTPYVDPSQLDVEWPTHSHYKQPWRAFMETKSGSDFLHGIGINLNVNENVVLAACLLAEAGFTAARIEIGWGHVNWDETGLNGEDQVRRRLGACRENGIRPTVLLNAHHGVPCPVRFFERQVVADAAQGVRSVSLDDVGDVVPGRTGLSNLTTYMAAEVFITEVDPATGECRLSKPLPKELKAGDTVLLATLKYLPAHPVGTPELREMAEGWERYVRIVLRVIAEAGIDDFDIEIWNELSFGSCFMGGPGINHYYDPPKVEMTTGFLHPGGHAWEIGRRTVDIVRASEPNAQCIWGFSNTTFFHTPIEELPPGMDGQSYHPYGTGTRKLPDREQAPDEPWRCLEGYVPTMEMRMPEGWAHTFIQTETLMRLLNPKARRRHPEGTERFRHYMTEHGVVPPECGIEDVDRAWDLKARCALRSFCFWLGKGTDVMHYYCAYDQNALGMGLLPAGLPELPQDASFDDVATPPMRAVQRLTQAFAESEELGEVTPLDVEVVALSEGRKVFGGGAEHPPLWERELLTVLPFQLTPRRFLVAVYVMTYDYTQRMPEQGYRLTVGGLPDGVTARAAYDPLEDRERAVDVVETGEGTIVLELPVSDSPRLVELSAGR